MLFLNIKRNCNYKFSSFSLFCAILLQLAIMGGPLERVRRADRRTNIRGMFGRGHGHACAFAQFASK